MSVTKITVGDRVILDQTRAPRVHYFESTGDAYDASQCCDEIKHGDVLAVPSRTLNGAEQPVAVAVLVEAWPVAISSFAGNFHRHDATWDWSKVDATGGANAYYMTASLELARAELQRLWDGHRPAEDDYFWARKFAAEDDSGDVGSPSYRRAVYGEDR
jgi:hypothetical protein